MKIFPQFQHLLAGGMALLLCGCGADERHVSADGVIQLNVLMEPDATGVWREVFASFNELNPSIRVNHIEGPTETNLREDLYVTSFLSGDAVYDLVFADVVWIPKFAAAGWLEDLSQRWPQEEWGRFIEGSIAGGTYRGGIYRVPTQMDAGMLYYRTDLLEAAGEQPPKTFDDLLRISQKLQKPEELWGYVWQGRQYEGLSCVFLEVLTGHGGVWIDPETNEVGLDKPEALAALEFLRRCIYEWKISPRGVTTYAEEDSRRLFHNGRAVFHRNWPYVWSLAQQDSPVAGRIGIVPMPANPGGRQAATLGGWGFAVASNSPHKDAAWQFLQYISAMPQIMRIQEVTGVQPALHEFYRTSDDPAMKAMYEVLQHAIPRPPMAQYAQASDILQRYVSSALTGRLTSEESLRRATRDTRLLLGRTERD